MKKNIFILIFLIQLIGCTGARFVKLEKLGEWESKQFKKDLIGILSETNPRFLDNVIDGLNIPNNLITLMSTNDMVIIQSLDRNYQSDVDLQLVIQRGLISKLLYRNIPVLERDINILLALLAESSINYNSSNLLSIYSDTHNDSLIKFNQPSKLKEATKILGYRVLEFGYLIVPLNDGMIERIGIIEIELRLIDALSSRILYSDILRNIYSDRISNDDYNIIDGLHFKFVSDALPLVKQEKAKDLIQLELEKREVSNAGIIKLTFLYGARESDVKIRNSITGELIKKFFIPSAGAANSDIYTYELKLVDSNGKPLPPGDYSIYIDDILVHRFIY